MTCQDKSSAPPLGCHFREELRAENPEEEGSWNHKPLRQGLLSRPSPGTEVTRVTLCRSSQSRTTNASETEAYWRSKAGEGNEPRHRDLMGICCLTATRKCLLEGIRSPASGGKAEVPMGAASDIALPRP